MQASLYMPVGGQLAGDGMVRDGTDHGGPDFQALLGPQVWDRLPVAVQRRFASPPSGLEIRYPGQMLVRASAMGWLIAQACRLAGTPLAPWTGDNVPVDVTVFRDGPALVWDRLYRFSGRAPVTVRSRKIIDRRDGLLEVVRGGLGMALTVSPIEGGLVFRSRHYFVTLGSRRIPIPQALTPGDATVIHRDLGGGRFLFSLAFDHPWFGQTMYQEGEFRDPAATVVAI
jgi:hypothetical protein